MKNAALFSGPLVAPSSSTLGTEEGRGVGSLKGWDEDDASWKVLIVPVDEQV